MSMSREGLSPMAEVTRVGYNPTKKQTVLPLLANFCIMWALEERKCVMPTVMNVNEAKANFSGLLSFVRKDRAVVTIVRYGHPIAQIVPCRVKRRVDTDPVLSQIQIKGSLFDDDSADWEAMND